VAAAAKWGLEVTEGPRPRLVFVDLETTGLDLYEGHILEVAFIVVETYHRKPPAAVKAFRSIVLPEGESLAKVEASMPDKVHAMHTESGLLGELLLAAEAQEWNRTLHKVTARAASFLDSSINRKVELAGFNPGFDLDWLKAKMPMVAARFGYRTFDCNALWLRDQYFSEDPSFQKPRAKTAHRAMSDCLDAFKRFGEEWHRWRAP
jgi:oligoribonuclease (3'-5' exoribonuclease)